MKEIPFLKIKDKKISFDVSSSDLRSLLNRLNETAVYVLDEDGVAKDHPNVSLYQRLASVAELWVDAGPRRVDDIMDDLFSGAHRIVIRPGLWNEVDLQSVIDITENELMVFYNISELRDGVPRDAIFSQSHYVILHLDEATAHIDFKMEGFIKQITKAKSTFVIDETNQPNDKWENLGVEGVFHPLEMMDVKTDE
jgi:uncharacterized protein related to proFAR isomerase